MGYDAFNFTAPIASIPKPLCPLLSGILLLQAILFMCLNPGETFHPGL